MEGRTCGRGNFSRNEKRLMTSLSVTTRRVDSRLTFIRGCLTLLCLVFLAVTAAKASAVTVQIQPLKDNTLVQGSNPAGQLSGGQGDIFAGRTNQDPSGPATV